MKLEVGMYIRTKDGIIARIKEIDNNERLYLNQKSIYTDDYKHDLIIDYEVIKASYNIIDILEVGDYVNGKKIVDVGCLTNGPRKGTKVIDYYITPSAVCYLENEDIKSIVTKEQFENMEYRIGE